jgi:LCP family protein required for cell wall assembly
MSDISEGRAPDEPVGEPGQTEASEPDTPDDTADSADTAETAATADTATAADAADAAATTDADDAAATAGVTADQLPPPRRRHRVRNTIIVLLSLFILAGGGVFAYAAYDVHTLTRNLKHTVLLPPGFTQPPEQVDAYGASPLNILLIGSDTRDTSQDAQLGGDSGPGANADSEMLVHLSADRSNATILSIPRDTVTQLPDCAGGDGMINSALQGGPECQVAAVHLLTGLTIDHYVMFDFSGVESISQDVGGVPVCVTANVKDPNSGLKLDKGTTNVQGLQALQFLRTRDAFYDGSDIGRERATHYFFSQLIQQMKASASFTNLTELQSLAQDVTKSTTVDNGLDSISALISLGEDLNKVPTDRITFLIMPWGADPDDSNRVVPTQPAANHVFAAMLADQSFTTDTGAAASPTGTATPKSSHAKATATPSPDAGSATPTPTTTPPDPAALAATESAEARAHPMHVNVINASGTTGRATTITQQVFDDGFVYVGGTDATWTSATTTLRYEPSEAKAAKELATDLNLPASALQPTATTSQMTLSIGSDWQIGTTYPAPQPTATATPTGAPSTSGTTSGSLPGDSFVQNAAATGGCITANPDDSF